MVEPFVTNAQNAGSRVPLTPYIDTASDLTVSTYFTSQGHIDSDPDVELHRHTNDYLLVYVTDDNGLEIAPPGQDASRQRCADGQTAHWEVGAEPGPAYSHTLRNVGTRTHRQILVELLGSSRSQESTGRPETNGRRG